MVGTYLNVGWGLPLDHRIKRIGPVNRNWQVVVHNNVVIMYYDIIQYSELDYDDVTIIPGYYFCLAKWTATHVENNNSFAILSSKSNTV